MHVVVVTVDHSSLEDATKLMNERLNEYDWTKCKLLGQVTTIVTVSKHYPVEELEYILTATVMEC